MNSRYMTLFILCTLCIGCASKTASGALVGGGLGAAAGGIAGGGKGALIGGAVGVIAGGLVGAALDEQDRRIMEQRSPSTVNRMDEGRPLTVQDVIELSQGGVSPDTIINYMRQSRARYSLNETQIRRMQNAGVDQRVINYMIDTGY